MHSDVPLPVAHSALRMQTFLCERFQFDDASFIARRYLRNELRISCDSNEYKTGIFPAALVLCCVVLAPHLHPPRLRVPPRPPPHCPPLAFRNASIALFTFAVSGLSALFFCTSSCYPPVETLFGQADLRRSAVPPVCELLPAFERMRERMRGSIA